MNKKKFKNKAELVIHILLIFIIGIYPLLLFELKFESFAIQHLVLFLCTMGALLYCVLRIRTGEWGIAFPRSRADLAIAVLAIYAMIQIIYKIIITNEENLESFTYEMVILALAALYLLITSKPVFQKIYFDILLYSALVVFALLLMKYFCGDGADGALAILLEDKSGISSYTVLVCIVGLWQYLKCKDKLRSFFYMGVLVIAFLVLFINQSRVSVWGMVMVFLAVPVCFRPTAELVKRDMTVFFVYLFMLCNMSLLTNYTNLLFVEVAYDLEQSIYLELLAAAGGIIFFRYWNRIPEGVDPKRLVMRKMRRGYQFLLKLTGVVFAGIILGGDHWSELLDQFGMKAVKGFTIPLVDEVRQGKGMFYLCFEQFGAIGSVLILCVCIFLLARVRKNCSFNKPVTGVLILISGVFFVQLLFWKVSISVLPIYWIFMVLAVSYKEEREKVVSNKIKFE